MQKQEGKVKSWLGTREFAAILEVSPSTVLNWARRGVIGERTAGRWRFREEDLLVIQRRPLPASDNAKGRE